MSAHVVTSTYLGRHLARGVFLRDMSAREVRAVAGLWMPMCAADAEGDKRRALDYARQILRIATNATCLWLMRPKRVASLVTAAMEAASLAKPTESKSVTDEAKVILLLDEVIWEICGMARMTDRQLLDNISAESIGDFYRSLQRQRLDEIADVVRYQGQYTGEGQKKILDAIDRQKKAIRKPGKQQGRAPSAIPKDVFEKKMETIREQMRRDDVVW